MTNTDPKIQAFELVSEHFKANSEATSSLQEINLESLDHAETYSALAEIIWKNRQSWEEQESLQDQVGELLELAKCSACTEWRDPENVCFEDEYDSGSSDYLCSECWENQNQLGTANFLDKQGKLGSIIMCDYQLIEDYDGADVPSEVLDFLKSLTWKNTDGWRGYYHFEGTLEGFKLLESDWFSGFDGYNLSNDNEILYKHLDKAREGKSAPVPFEILTIFTRTSNVFSTATDLYIPEHVSEAEFKEFISELKKGTYDL